MKKFLFLSTLFLGALIFSAVDVKAQAAAATAGGHCDCKSCDCWSNYGNCMWAVTSAEYSGAANEMPVLISIVSGNTVLIENQAQVVTHETSLDLSSAVQLPASVCNQLGVASITLSVGSYVIDYSQNPLGNIICDASIVNY